jgi:DNA polymerase-4
MRERKSVGKETTLAQDIEDREAMLYILGELAGQVERRLQELGLQGKTVTLKVKWNDFQLFTRSMTTLQPIQEKQATMQEVRSLFRQLEYEKRPVRLLGVSISYLVLPTEKRQVEQLSTPSLWEHISSEERPVL